MTEGNDRGVTSPLAALLPRRGDPEPADLRDRYRGVLLGVAAGNALGAEAEGSSAEGIAARFGRITDVPDEERHRPWDDDLAQTVVLAEAILHRDTVEAQDLGTRLVHWYRTNGRGIGMLTARVLHELGRGAPPRDAARVVWERSGRRSAGNGAVMRCWPVGLRWRRSAERLVSGARASATVTHFDPRCEWSTVAAVVTLVLALEDRSAGPPALAEALDQAGAPDEVGGAVRAVSGAGLEDLALDDPAAMGYTLKAMQVALWCLGQERDFEGVLGDVVNAGGDTDTNGAVAGAVMGGRLGTGAIPARWTANIPGTERLVELADRLFARAAGLPEEENPPS